jgi:hypothetical protein
MKCLRNLLQPLLVVLVGGLLITNSAQAEQTCHQINAKGKGQVHFDTNTSDGQIIGGGLLHGTTHGEFTFTGVDTFEGTFTITTNHGTLILHTFDGVFDAGTGAFSNNSVVIAGTGRFEDATGGLFFEGAVASDGSYTDQITGQICLDLP